MYRNVATIVEILYNIIAKILFETVPCQFQSALICRASWKQFHDKLLTITEKTQDVDSWTIPSEVVIDPLETTRQISLPIGWDSEIVRSVYKAVIR